MSKFNIGDRVRIKRSYSHCGGPKARAEGTVCQLGGDPNTLYDAYQRSQRVGVHWDEPVSEGIDCAGTCPREHGRWTHVDNLILIEKYEDQIEAVDFNEIEVLLRGGT